MSTEPLVCVVEIPKGSRNKYEYDSKLGAIKLDRFVSASVVYPTDYGYVPQTVAPDGDPLDALVSVSEPTFPGWVVPSHFFEVYKDRDPDRHSEVRGWGDVAEAWDRIRWAREQFASGAERSI